MAEDTLCDTCGKIAWFWAAVNGVTLAYCAHHATEYYDALLLASGGAVIDHRDQVLGVKGEATE